MRIVGIQKETVDQVFPRLDDLMDINGTFLNLLKATEGADSVVDCIGDVLVQQVSSKCYFLAYLKSFNL